MSDLVGNPEGRFSHDKAHMMMTKMFSIVSTPQLIRMITVVLFKIIFPLDFFPNDSMGMKIQWDFLNI